MIGNYNLLCRRLKTVDGMLIAGDVDANLCLSFLLMKKGANQILYAVSRLLCDKTRKLWMVPTCGCIAIRSLKKSL